MSNFAFLSNATLRELGVMAEKLFASDADACAARVRIFCERLVDEIIVACRIAGGGDFARRLKDVERHPGVGMPGQVAVALEKARKVGNQAAHRVGLPLAKANEALRCGWRAAVWFESRFGRGLAETKQYQTPDHRDAEAKLRAEAQARAIAEAEKARAEGEAAELARRLSLPQIHFHGTLNAAWGEMAEPEQRRLEAFLESFRADPEAVRLVRLDGDDDKLYSAAVDEALCVVVAVPPRGDAMMCLWAGAPDAAQAWAAAKRVEIHPVLCAVQVFDVEEAQGAAGAGDGGFFERWSDEDLLRLGVPALLLPSVRAVKDREAFEHLAEHLPHEAAEGLALLEAADSVDDVLQVLDRPTPPEHPDLEDYEVALAAPASQQRFRAVELDETFAAVLAGSLEAWRTYLHPDQQRLVRMRANGPVRVLGGAGTGKTVALLHRAAHLSSEIPEGRFLVTTYTRNLALQLERQLAELIPAEQLDRFDVLNLHRAARKLLDGTDAPARPAKEDALRDAWSTAMEKDTLGLPISFYKEEWETVVQPSGITDRGGYMRARRKGRGSRLGPAQKQAMWAVFAAYRGELSRANAEEWPDIVRRARASVESAPPYRAVLCDEVQDLTPEDLRFVRALAPEDRDDLFLVGDAHQRIYGRPVTLKSCGIHIVGRSRRLRVNYRTTQRIRDLAVSVVEQLDVDDLDGELDTLLGYRSLRVGEPPTVRHFPTADEEEAFVLATLRAWLTDEPPEALCLATRTRALGRRYRTLAEEAGIPTHWLDPNDETPGPGVRFSTFHRMKGLEFKRVLLASVQHDTVPLTRGVSFPDPLSRKAHEQKERCLFYVAATRARDALVVSGFGRPSPLSPS